MDRIQLTPDPTIAEALRRVQARTAPAARTTEMSPADVAAHEAASHVRTTPKPTTIAQQVDETTGLTATGRAALRRLETELAWRQR